MAITTNQVRELAAKGEGTILDFKREQYDWSKPAINAELAKDVMAIANELRLGGPNGYILIGVANEGTIHGIPASAHVDDADVHRRVTHFLNRSPTFSYSSVDVDGRSIGVFEIEPGGRPYFPVKDSGSVLVRRLPLHRNGTTTEAASPLHVLDWAKEDDPHAVRLRELEIEERIADRAIHGTMHVRDLHTGPGIEAMTLSLEIRNLGRRLFTLEALRWRIEWTPMFFAVVKSNIEYEDRGRRAGDKLESRAYWRRGEAPPNYTAPSGDKSLSLPGGRRATIPPGTGLGQGASIPFSWTQGQSATHFEESGIRGDYIQPEWFDIHFELDVVGEFGNRDMFTCSSSD